MTMLTKDRPPITHECPRCSHSQVCRAHRVGGWDRVLSMLNIYPYRCRQYFCKNRFYRFGKSI
ncbi:hypothetical protein [Chamaesiphon sp.]|uniref:hypothetical protein n=1 Tax=Chamaesiphon sp. TaxID=2814140 RepID=UPI0035946FB8